MEMYTSEWVLFDVWGTYWKYIYVCVMKGYPINKKEQMKKKNMFAA